MADKSQTYAKIGILGAIVLVVIMSALTGQSPVDVIFNFVKDIFVFLFFILIVAAPVVLIGYLFIICFTNYDSPMGLSFSEVTKNRISSMFQSGKRENKKAAKKKAKKVPAKKKTPTKKS